MSAFPYRAAGVILARAIRTAVETPEPQQTQNREVVLLSFFDELRRNVPLRGKSSASIALRGHCLLRRG
jgi:hypothetical protein